MEQKPTVYYASIALLTTALTTYIIYVAAHAA